MEDIFKEICHNKDNCIYSTDCVAGNSIESSYPYVPLYISQLIGEGYYYCDKHKRTIADVKKENKEMIDKMCQTIVEETNKEMSL